MIDKETGANSGESREKKSKLLSRIGGRFQRIASNVRSSLGRSLKEPNLELNGNKDAILNEINEKYVKVKRAVKLGKEGRIVRINLPAVGEEFETCSFSFFVSDYPVKRKTFELNPIYEENSKSMDSFVKFLESLRKYMKARGVKIDWNSEEMRDKAEEHGIKLEEYEPYMKAPGGRNLFYGQYEAVECLMKIIGRYWEYKSCWLKDVGKFRQVLSFDVRANEGKQGMLFFDCYNHEEDAYNLVLDA